MKCIILTISALTVLCLIGCDDSKDNSPPPESISEVQLSDDAPQWMKDQWEKNKKEAEQKKENR